MSESDLPPQHSEPGLNPVSPGFTLPMDIYASVVFTADPEGRFSTPQPEWAWFTGQTWEEYHGMGWTAAIHPDDLERVVTVWDASMKKGGDHRLEFRLWHAPSGEYHHTAERAVRVLEHDGTPREWIGVISDIHHAKEASFELKKSRQRIDLMFEQAIVGMTQSDLKGRFTLVNQRFCEIAGRTMEDLLTRRVQEITHPDDVLREDALRSNSMVLGKGYEIQKRYLRPDGSIVWVRNYVSIIRDEDGAPVFGAALVQDITAQRAAEEQRVQLILRERSAREEAERANRAKDEFLATLSHELRTPLTPVLMTASALEKDPTLPERVREDLAVIRRNVELEARLIDDLLDLTRISRGKLVLLDEVLDLHALIPETMEIVRADAEAAGVAVEFELAAKEHYVQGDPARLRQVVWNLLKNAIKFTPRGGKVMVQSENPKPGYILLRVVDTGLGIAPQALERIFNAFEQGSVHRRFGGLGLGLAISKAVVDVHGGRIYAESAGEGHGAAFNVELRTTEAKPVDAEKPQEGTCRGGVGMRLLLVEDHAQTLLVLTRLLNRRGYRTTGVATVREALEIAEKETFDLVISDIGLPDGSGLDVMRELSRRYHMQGIALSGFGMEEDMLKTRAAGFRKHLVKPVSVEQLVAAIKEIEK